MIRTSRSALSPPFTGALIVAAMAVLHGCGGGSGDDPDVDFGPSDEGFPPAGQVPEDSMNGAGTPADEPLIIVDEPAGEEDLVPGGGGLLYRGYDNVAIIDTEPTDSADPVVAVVEEVEFTVEDPSPNIRVERVFAVPATGDTTPGEGEVHFIAIITNLTDVAHCGFLTGWNAVTLKDGSTFDAVNGVLSAQVAGAVGDNILNNPPFDCLLPATSAYLYIDNTSIQRLDPDGPSSGRDLLIGETQSISLRSIRGAPRPDLEFPVGVVNTMGAGANGAFTIFNTSDGALDLFNASIFAIDADGRPIGVRDYSVNDFREPLEPGGSANIGFREGAPGAVRYVISVGYDTL